MFLKYAEFSFVRADLIAFVVIREEKVSFWLAQDNNEYIIKADHREHFLSIIMPLIIP